MRTAMTCLSVLLQVTLAAAQAQPPERAAQVAQAIEVPAINLEVFVTDSDGQPVTDLERGDFRLFEDGEPIAFDLFEPPADLGVGGGERSGGERPAAEARHSVAGAPANIVLFIDEFYPAAGNRQLLLRELARWAREDLPRGSRLMILSYEGATRIVLPFSSDRGEIDAGLASAASYISPRRLLGDRDDREILDVVQWDAQNRGCLNGLQYARAHADARRAEAESTIFALSRLVDTMEALPGRKFVLYVGDGIPLRPGQEAIEYYIEACGGTGAQQGLPEAKDATSYGPAKWDRYSPELARNDLPALDTSSQWRRLAARANGQGVALYSLTASSVPLLDRVGAESQRRTGSALTHSGAAQDRLATLALIANETGARMLHGGPRAGEELLRLRDDLGSYYLLGFTPGEAENPRVRALRVEVARPGLRVRHRQSYAVKGAAAWGSDRLLAHLLYGVGENPLGLRLETQPTPEPTAPVRFRLHVPLARLAYLPGESGREGRFTAYLVARDESGATTPVRFKSFPVSLSAKDPAAGPNRDFVWEVAIDLAAGRHDVAVAVRDEVGGEVAYVTQSVTRRAVR